MNKMPIISVVTPSFNCADYIRQCIESVLAQNYDNFEHVIIDGASTDGTVEILKQYPHLRWVSEPDKGEGEALNKALRMARGDIIGWLNADDYYQEGVFRRVAQEINPQQNRHMVYGNTRFIDEKGVFIREKRSAPVIALPLLLRWWRHARHPHQPSIFYSRELIRAVGFFNQDLHFSIDYEYWLRAILNYRFFYVDQIFSVARLRADSKSLNTVPGQIQSHWRVGAPYHRYLSFYGRVKFWSDYHVYQLLTQVRTRIRLRTRLRRAMARMKTKGRKNENSV